MSSFFSSYLHFRKVMYSDKNALAEYQDLAFPVPLSVAQKPKFLVNQSENLKRPGQ